MRSWSYAAGHWEEVSPRPEQRDDQEWKDYVKSLGFDGTATMTWGDSQRHGFHVEVTETSQDHLVIEALDKEVAAQFLVVVNTVSNFYPVFVGALPDLVRLMQELRPMIASEHEFWQQKE